MGWLTRWRFVSRVAREQQDVRSAQFAADDVHPIDQIIVAAHRPGWNWGRMARDTALQIPAVLRGRNLICSISTLPLVQVAADHSVVESPLLKQIDPNVANVVTLAQTVEDLLLESIAWWQVLAYGWDGYPVSARHVDVDKVSLTPPPGYQLQTLPSGIDPKSVVWVEGKPVDGRQMIRFDSPNPGLLDVARRTLRRAVMLEQAAAMYADNPQMLGWFSPVEDADPVDDDEIEEILADWESARRDHSTGYVPAALRYNPLSVMSPADLQLRQLQDRVVLDMANMLGLDPEDFGLNVTSRTYQNVTDRRQDRINDVLSSYMLALTQRLSMNDITKRGHGVQHDLTEYLRADPRTRSEVDGAYLDRGILTRDEVRGGLKRPALTPEQRRDIADARSTAAPTAPATDSPTEEGAAVSAQNSRTPLALVTAAGQFDAGGEVRFSFDATTTAFAVDTETRTITGLAVPYGVAATNGWATWEFRPGALSWSAVGRVKLLREHDTYQLLGVATELTDTPQGMQAKFRVASTPAGDEALALAKDGVLDGLSIGVVFADDGFIRRDDGVFEVVAATLREVSLCAIPAFDDSRVTSVAASASPTPREGFVMPCTVCGRIHAAGAPCATQPLTGATLATTAVAPTIPTQPAAPSAESLMQEIRQGFAALPAAIAEAFAGIAHQPPAAGEGPTAVNPHGSSGNPTTAQLSVAEELPYRFGGRGGPHDFSADIFAAAQQRSGAGDALERLNRFMAQAFAVSTGDVDELNPARNRPELWVGALEYNTPIWDAIAKGTIPDATPFTLPKFNTSSGLVGNHTQGTEPTPGAFTTTGQTITPSAVSGKVEITRETIDQGGNPQLSDILWAEINRNYNEALEVKAAAMLDALTPTAIAIATALADKQLAAAMNGSLAALQFVAGGFRMRDLFLNATLFTALVQAVDDVGRPLFPLVAPANAQGETGEYFGDLMVGSLRARPAWALAAPATAVGSSYLLNRGDCHGWATPPRELKFEYRVALVDLGVWGYTALANTRLAGVRELTYDPVV